MFLKWRPTNTPTNLINGFQLPPRWGVGAWPGQAPLQLRGARLWMHTGAMRTNRTTRACGLRVAAAAALLFLLAAVLCDAAPPVAERAGGDGTRAARAKARLAAVAGRGGRRAEGKSASDKYAWVYAVGGKGLIIASRDAGDTWKPLESGVTADLYDVACTDARNCLVVGDKGTVLSTSNLGNDWEAVDVLSVEAKLRGLYIMLSPETSGGPTYMVGDKGLFVSTEDGEEFSASVLKCTAVGAECQVEDMPTSQGVWNNLTNPLTLVAARFRDLDNGVLVALGGEIVLVSGDGEPGGKLFTLAKPVTITGTQFHSIVSVCHL